VLYVVGDSNTGIFSPAANTLSIATGGGERARITDSLITLNPDVNIVGILRAYADGTLVLQASPAAGPVPAGIDMLGRLGVLLDLTVGGNVAVAGAIDTDASLDVGTSLLVGTTAAIGGNTSVGGSLGVEGPLDATTGSFSGAVTVQNAAAGNQPVALGQFTGTLSATGYTRFPNGLVMQWGTGTLSDGTVTIMLPVAFTSAAFNVQISPLGPLYPEGPIPALAYNSIALDRFVVDGPDDAAYTFSWMALGWSA
jgi:hypothetical protein